MTTDTTTTFTITEALAEIKTIGKRIEKKREFIRSNLVRAEGLKDPLANQGGSVQTIVQEIQSIFDLEERVIAIRREIQRANSDTLLKIRTEGGASFTRSIADWLVWRREVAGPKATFLVSLRSTIEQYRQHARQKGIALVSTASEATKPQDLIVHLDEKLLAETAENLEHVLGQLDGKLSLLNATTTITVA